NGGFLHDVLESKDDEPDEGRADTEEDRKQVAHANHVEDSRGGANSVAPGKGKQNGQHEKTEECGTNDINLEEQGTQVAVAPDLGTSQIDDAEVRRKPGIDLGHVSTPLPRPGEKPAKDFERGRKNVATGCAQAELLRPDPLIIL